MASLQRFMGLGKHPAYDGAIAYFDAEQYSDAIPLFEMTLQECNDPTVQKLARAYLAESYAKVGYKRAVQGNWASAYNYFTMATDYAPQYADWWFQAGFAAYKQGDYASAQSAFQQATQVNPTFARAWFGLGLAQYASGQHETALETLQRWLVSMRLTNDQFQNALELHQAGRFAEAQQAFEQFLQSAEDNFAEYIRWGDEAYQQGDLTAAEACFRHVLNARPNYADVRNRLGVVLTALGRSEEAVEQFIAALRINPRYVEAHINLAITYYELGFADQAKAHYHQVLQIDPENRVAQEALRQLAA